MFRSLYTAASGMMAQQLNLDNIANNLANASTAGFSRQRAIFVESDPVVISGLTFGTGVDLQKVESVRDSILELRMLVELQRQGMLGAVVSGMQQVEPMFSGSSGDIADQLAKFFNSWISSRPIPPAFRCGRE